jgi:hypothetical protein
MPSRRAIKACQYFSNVCGNSDGGNQSIASPGDSAMVVEVASKSPSSAEPGR